MSPVVTGSAIYKHFLSWPDYVYLKQSHLSRRSTSSTSITTLNVVIESRKEVILSEERYLSFISNLPQSGSEVHIMRNQRLT